MHDKNKMRHLHALKVNFVMSYPDDAKFLAKFQFERMGNLWQCTVCMIDFETACIIIPHSNIHEAFTSNVDEQQPVSATATFKLPR